MVTEELKAEIRVGNVNMAISQDHVDEIKEREFKTLQEMFAPMSEQIARGATSYTQAFPGRKEISRPAAKACRTIMQAARHDDVPPTERIDVCETVGVDIGDLMNELDKL